MSTGPAITVRPVRLDEVDALRALRIEALTRCPLAFGSDAAEAEARPMEAWQTQVAGATGEGANVIFVAEDERGRLVGMSAVYTLSQIKLAHTADIVSVYVRDDHRGCGVGRALMQACIDWSRSKGLLVLKLGVAVGNIPARRCYERCGFIEYGVEPMAIRWEGKLYDEALMALRLSDPA